MRCWAALLSALALFACSPSPQHADPALWKVESPQGQVGWLFGTIHSSPRPLEWETPAVHDALRSANMIMVEVGNLADEAEVGATFARLAKSSGQPPLSQRISSEERPALAALLKRSGYADGDFAAMDTWAAALTLARNGAGKEDARNGVDRAVIANADGRPVTELEGAVQQLGLFDSLPEREQRDLLGAVVREASEPDHDLSDKWRTGDMAAIEAETRTGLLADPELREVLFTGRNRRWTASIAEAIEARRKPFVAVGAAHMAGPDGLPAMLARQGFTVTRVE
ncbi:TraB/GumN family protein [Novosphingobium mangrovi (ex Huang et al. 2023)]|uniref:TraB/GumN family protein n=1 Tax=Novosphingobium mangrovi (ex Huang et al. 2023) TaxID=2976432 RepID=A0ABT2I7I9_9SPHN|nr:TraB/GumN family protein [Novosphingobium mangrovi (ex Huang et al. 2023)]MCT2400759.1 TraB/GumN family protein [Novosphingobium mangrovi (ex Huang et al. 2023)]